MGGKLPEVTGAPYFRTGGQMIPEGASPLDRPIEYPYTAKSNGNFPNCYITAYEKNTLFTPGYECNELLPMILPAHKARSEQF